MSGAEIIVAVLRGAHDAALVSLFGTLVFLTLVARGAMALAVAEAPRLRRRLLRLAAGSAACALITGASWLVVETVVMADTVDVATTLHALPVVALQTQYGQWMLVRGALLLAILPLLLFRWTWTVIATVLAGVALALQPMLGHAGAVGGSVGTTLIVSEAMHLLAAGAWLGALLPLFITIGTLPHAAAAQACRGFTPVGLSAVVILAGTATVQVTELMGGMPGLFGTGYGHVALVKLALFGLLLVLAALNRLALTNRLAGAVPGAAGRHMRISIATETVLGLAVVITAGFLATHEPGVHEQPVWPFAWRPALATLSDPASRDQIVGGLLGLGAAAGVAVAGLMWRRARRPALALAAIIASLATPHLELLFVEAYPTSFFTSPTEFAATAIVHGAKLFATNCVACHGVEGHGDGPAAKALPMQPADLTAQHLWAHNDGEMFWYVSHGFAMPDGRVAMPGFAGTLSTEARWDLIDYLRAHNAGESLRTTGVWAHPVPVPQFDADCPDGRAIDLDDLRGRMIRIIAPAEDEMLSVPREDNSLTTILLSRRRGTPVDTQDCVATEPESWTAFAILSGVSDDALAGEQILVDQNHWLRASWRPGEKGDWSNAHALAAVVAGIAAHPLPVDAGGGQVHRH